MLFTHEPPLTYKHIDYIARAYQHRFFAPEEATYAENYYTVCSHYTTAIYYNTFNDTSGNPYIYNEMNKKVNSKWYFLTSYLVGIANPNSTYYNKDIAVLYIKNPSVSNTETREYDSVKAKESKKQILETVKPGDIIVYRRTTGSGHAIFYAGDGYMYESAAQGGGIYNFKSKTDKKEPNGSIRKMSLSEYSLGENKNILSTVVTDVSIFRPLIEIENKGYKLNNNSKARLNYPDLNIYKTAFDSRYQTVTIGNNITYNIKLTNEGNTIYNNIKITDKVPTNTTFVSASNNATVNGNNLEWTISLNPNESKTITFTVKVKNDESLVGKYITSNNTVVGGIKAKEINTLVGNTLDADFENQIKERVNSLKNKSYNNIETFINEVYNNKYVNISDIDTLINKYFDNSIIDVTNNKSSPIYSDYFNGNHDTGEQTAYSLKKNLSVKDMYVNGLYGGIYTVEENSTVFNDEVRMTYLKTADLSIGDVLVINDPDLKQMYLYKGDNEFATIENNNVVITNSTKSTEILDSLLGQNNFIVLRPSLAIPKKGKVITRYLEEETNKELANQSEELKYYGETYTTSKSSEVSSNYEYVGVEGSSSGTVDREEIVVVYYYKLKDAKVIVHHYVKGTTTKLLDDEISTKKYGESYSTTSKDSSLPYYNLDSKSGNTSGTINKDNTEVIYYYKLKDAKVVTKYLEKGTNKQLASSVTTDYHYGDTYVTKEGVVPNNYSLVQMSNEVTGIVNKDVIEVIYYYQKKDSKIDNSITKTGIEKVTSSKDKNNYVINYNATIKDYIGKAEITIVDKLPYKIDEGLSELNGGIYDNKNRTITWKEEISNFDSYSNEKINITKNINVVYSDLNVEDRAFANEVVGTVELDNNGSSVVATKVTESKIPGTITVKYIDENDKEITESVEVEGLAGDFISTESKEIEGYNLKEKPESEVVKLTEGNIEVIYKYEKIKYNIITKIISGEGVINKDQVIEYGKDSDKIEIKAEEGYYIKSVKVNGEVQKIGNYVKKLTLDGFKNIKENKLIEVEFAELPGVVKIPDTGNTVVIAGIVAGVALICGGGYFLYRRYN